MQKPVVLRSIESPDGARCVDIFRRADDTFGFEEYRRDPEDPRGWAAVGNYDGLRFASEEEAERHARADVAWLGAESGDARHR